MIKYLILCIGFLLTTNSYAVSAPLGIAFFPKFEFPEQKDDVRGIRISLGYGDHANVYGLDFGLIGNATMGTFAGTALSGAFNYTKKSYVVGGQLAGIVNWNSDEASIFGLQGALGGNVNGKGTLVGIQLAGIMNYSSEMLVLGVQAGSINFGGSIVGVQLGVFNKAKTVYGLQFGIVNMADNLHGVQIGLLNFGGIINLLPIINIGI